VVLAVLGGSAIAVAASRGRDKAGSPPTAATSASVGHSKSPQAAPVTGDEFTGTKLNSSIWNVYSATAHNGSQWKPSQVRVSGGELRIVGTGKNATGSGNLSGGLCWCGRDGNRIYGTWQVRAKFDAGPGYHQIIGLWPKSDKGDIDGSITFAGTPDADKHTVHGQLTWQGGAFERKLTGDFTAWHTYMVVWQATFVKMYVDGELFFDSSVGASGLIVPHTPMHLIMQQEVGPVGGVPAPNASTPDNVLMHIDWVHTTN